VGRVDVGVSEPVADHVDIVSRSKQMHGCGVPEGVRINGFRLQRGALILSGGRVFANDVAGSKAGDGQSFSAFSE
jgi:hypothetical protein